MTSTEGLTATCPAALGLSNLIQGLTTSCLLFPLQHRTIEKGTNLLASQLDLQGINTVRLHKSMIKDQDYCKLYLVASIY